MSDVQHIAERQLYQRKMKNRNNVYNSKNLTLKWIWERATDESWNNIIIKWRPLDGKQGRRKPYREISMDKNGQKP